jgi:hypothetical protein
MLNVFRDIRHYVAKRLEETTIANVLQCDSHL